jgi:hypothetical protein
MIRDLALSSKSVNSDPCEAALKDMCDRGLKTESSLFACFKDLRSKQTVINGCAGSLSNPSHRPIMGIHRTKLRMSNNHLRFHEPVKCRNPFDSTGDNKLPVCKDSSRERFWDQTMVGGTVIVCSAIIVIYLRKQRQERREMRKTIIHRNAVAEMLLSKSSLAGNEDEAALPIPDDQSVLALQEVMPPSPPV